MTIFRYLLDLLVARINKKIFSNVVALFCIKGLDYIMALLLLPYLIRILGPERFGAIAFAQGYIQYFIIISDYGFNLSAPRAVAVNADNLINLKKIVSGVVGAKFILCIVSITVYLITIYYFRIFYQDILLYLIMILLLLGNVMYPVWFFQGIQKMKYITYANIMARIISTIAIFCLVNSEDDYLTAALLQSITPVIAGAISLCLIYKEHRHILVFPDFSYIRKAFIDGWDVFLSTAAISTYTSSTIFFLGLFHNQVVVGYFAAAEKMIKTITRLMEPVSQAIYPYISVLAAESKQQAILFLRKCVIYIGGIMFLVSMVILINAELIAENLFGSAYYESVGLLRIISFLPFIIGLSNVFGIQTMLTFGFNTLFSRIVLVSAIINTILIIPAAYFFAATGACVVMMITELFVTAAMWIMLNKRGINLL